MSQRIGQVGVYMTVATLLRTGYQVAEPLLDTGHDLVAYEGRKFWRVQVKSHRGKRKHDLVRLQRGKDKSGRYCMETADAIAVCDIESGLVRFAPIQAVTGRSAISINSPLLVPPEVLRDSLEALD